MLTPSVNLFVPQMNSNSSTVFSRLPADLLRVLGPAVVQQHGEFVAAEARDDVVRANPLLQHFTELAQQFVASDVAAGVVHRLEAIEVEVEHRVLDPGRQRHLERSLQPQLEFAAVRRPVSAS